MLPLLDYYYFHILNYKGIYDIISNINIMLYLILIWLVLDKLWNKLPDILIISGHQCACRIRLIFKLIKGFGFYLVNLYVLLCCCIVILHQVLLYLYLNIIILHQVSLYLHLNIAILHQVLLHFYISYCYCWL